MNMRCDPLLIHVGKLCPISALPPPQGGQGSDVGLSYRAATTWSWYGFGALLNGTSAGLWVIVEKEASFDLLFTFQGHIFFFLFNKGLNEDKCVCVCARGCACLGKQIFRIYFYEFLLPQI